jgi:murein DD-endopeptidase MepM/ murein hydrolase activator NlpD
MITINSGASSETTIANIISTVLVAPGPNIAGGSATADLHFMNYQNKPIAFYGTGINQTTGKTTVTVTMKNGTKLAASFTIGKRVSPTESLAVPADLGGNSTSSQEALVANLDAENAELADVYSNPDVTFWNAPFIWPVHAADVVGGIVITDPFGYERDSGAEEIIHKGTDFKAPPGTPVYAINAGYVRVTKLFSVYGNTVIVDHGMGIQSFYMHLSKMVVTVGEPVKQGQLLGYSGETGYSEGPHLHLTIRVGGISIDPMVFLGFFGLKPDSYAD